MGTTAGTSTALSGFELTNLTKPMGAEVTGTTGR